MMPLHWPDFQKLLQAVLQWESIVLCEISERARQKSGQTVTGKNVRFLFRSIRTLRDLPTASHNGFHHEYSALRALLEPRFVCVARARILPETQVLAFLPLSLILSPVAAEFGS